ncbi:MAG: tripartite tricarboxylate transporter substrate-binding protein [Pirellulales bacterium]
MATLDWTFRRGPGISLLLAVALVAGCRGQQEYPDRPITLICPWAAGGGTDRVSRQVAAHLETELGVPVNVVNATGGKGVTGHSRGLRADPDGYTIAMVTLELAMMHWSGLTNLTTEDCVPLASLNEDYAALFVRDDAPWHTLAELQRTIRARPGELRASGTSTGGAWHLAAAGWLLTIGLPADAVNWISSTGAGPSLQGLLSGEYDMVCCSLPEAKPLYASGQIRTIGVMAPSRIADFAGVPTFVEQGTDWSLGGWRALALPQGAPPEVVGVLTPALEQILTGQTTVAGTTFPQFMEQSGFDHTWRTGQPLQEFLKESDRKLGKLLTSDAMRTVNSDRFNPMAFPSMLMILMGAMLLLLVGRRLATGPLGSPEEPRARREGQVCFVAVVGSVIVYLIAAETIGFVLLTGGLLLVLFYSMGARLQVAVPLAVAFPPVVYQLFAHLLRVPLPRGWLGW